MNEKEYLLKEYILKEGGGEDKSHPTHPERVRPHWDSRPWVVGAS